MTAETQNTLHKLSHVHFGNRTPIRNICIDYLGYVD